MTQTRTEDEIPMSNFFSWLLSRAQGQGDIMQRRQPSLFESADLSEQPRDVANWDSEPHSIPQGTDSSYVSAQAFSEPVRNIPKQDFDQSSVQQTHVADVSIPSNQTSIMGGSIAERDDHTHTKTVREIHRNSIHDGVGERERTLWPSSQSPHVQHLETKLETVREIYNNSLTADILGKKKEGVLVPPPHVQLETIREIHVKKIVSQPTTDSAWRPQNQAKEETVEQQPKSEHISLPRRNYLEQAQAEERFIKPRPFADSLTVGVVVPTVASRRAAEIVSSSRLAVESPTIHVTIGRVEVRASQAQPTASPRSNRPAAPRMSLDDYLRHRSTRRER